MSTKEIIYRSCPTCEASCGLTLEVDRDRGDILSIKGDTEDTRSNGYVCAKSQAFAHIHSDPERLRRPVKRIGDDWIEVEWDEALTDIATRLKATRELHGKDAIAMYYGNPNGHNFHTQIYTQLFIQMLNTERFFSAGSVDQQPKNLSSDLLYGNPWLFPVPDLARTDFFVCMGGNPLVSVSETLDVSGGMVTVRASERLSAYSRDSMTMETMEASLSVGGSLSAFAGGSWITTWNWASPSSGSTRVASPSSRVIFGSSKSADDHGHARCSSTISGSSSIVTTSCTDGCRAAPMAV